QVGVLKTIALTGALLGSASASSLNNAFTATAFDGGSGGGNVPEPTTLLLSGGGLIALGLIRRRKNRK
ncbi:MAG: PEP-CTERM sorting domain-containing protein, partial [Bryobacteraceae bacterium]